MLSIQMYRLIVEEREREIQAAIRARRLLRREPDSDLTADEEAMPRYRDSWRARTPRASATTR
jgi:hypothetical protein